MPNICSTFRAEALRHEFDAEASAKDMEETYLPAFEGLVKEAKVEAVMGAYNRTNGEPCCGSPTLQKKLRGEWKFQGILYQTAGQSVIFMNTIW